MVANTGKRRSKKARDGRVEMETNGSDRQEWDQSDDCIVTTNDVDLSLFMIQATSDKQKSMSDDESCHQTPKTTMDEESLSTPRPVSTNLSSTASIHFSQNFKKTFPSDEEMDVEDYCENAVPQFPVSRVGQIVEWDGEKYLSALLQDGLAWLHRDDEGGRDVIMVFESPSSASTETSFHNTNQFIVHDYPAWPRQNMVVIQPLRYAIMNGGNFPVYMVQPPTPELAEHWCRAIPGFQRPTFVHLIPSNARVSVYFPLERDVEHIVNPTVQYELSGKDAIQFMTEQTTRLLPNSKDVRPCIAKVTHGMGSQGIMAIWNDKDEAQFARYVREAGNPTYVVTELIDIQRNMSCHFFIHPNGTIVWIGTSENLHLPDGTWSADSTIDMNKQQEFRELLTPYMLDVANYCLTRGYWGFAGIDVLFDKRGNGFVVDVNPRVTATMPALMLARLFRDEYGLHICKFRKSANHIYKGSATELIRLVDNYNDTHNDEGRVVLVALHEDHPKYTRVNIAVFGRSFEMCDALLERFTCRV